MIEQHPFHKLLPQQFAPLKRRALKLTASEHRAQDLLQTTLLKAWAARDSYRSDSNLRRWLFTIMRNTYFSDLRKMRREVEDVDGAFARTLAEAPRQEDSITLNELLAAIAQLPSVQSRPLVMMGAYGFSQLETATACDCTVGTIKSRVSRSRDKLSQLMDRDRMTDGTPFPNGDTASRQHRQLTRGQGVAASDR